MTVSGICLLDEQVEELAALLAEAAQVMREEDGDLATRLLLWADTVQGDGDFEAALLAEFGQYVTGDFDEGFCCSRCAKAQNSWPNVDESFWFAVASDETGCRVDVVLCDTCYTALGQPSHASLEHTR